MNHDYMLTVTISSPPLSHPQCHTRVSYLLSNDIQAALSPYISRDPYYA